ncbi:MAG: DUF6159 family protein [Methanoregula sp.]|nr:DUF6159 family protein [Methanoregula sp.]
MTRVSVVIRGWLGWCPNAPAMHTASTVLSTPPVSLHSLEPDGGTGGSGRIGRGISFAVGSIKTLIRNKQLFWLSFLTGLVMLFMFVSFYLIHVFGMYPYPPIEYPLWLTLNFAVALISVFCLYFLLASLIASISPGHSGKPITLREGFDGAKKHVRSLLVWSVLIALLGTALSVLMTRYFGEFSFTFIRVIDQFPFNFILLPEVYSTGPIGGGYHIASAVTSTFFAVTINVIFFVLTLFVVPALVLENKRLPGAVTETISLIKKVWGEIIACFLLFCLISLVISLASFIFRIAYGLVSPNNLLFWYPGEGWIAGAAMYILAWCILAVIGSTAVGIALFGLYTYAKTDRMPGMHEEEQGVQVLK